MVARKLLYIILLLIIGTPAFATAGTKQQTFIDKQQWKELSKDYSYAEKIKERKQKAKKNKPWSFNWFPNLKFGGWVKYAIYIVVIILLVTLLVLLIISLYKDTQEKLKNPNLTIKDLNVDDIQQIEDSALLRILQEALASGLFKDAIRIQYLMLIRQLSALQMVTWKKDKTNGAYLTEMYGKAGFELFRIITIGFDRIWYGDKEITEQEYLALIPLFDDFGKIIGPNNQPSKTITG